MKSQWLSSILKQVWQRTMVKEWEAWWIPQRLSTYFPKLIANSFFFFILPTEYCPFFKAKPPWPFISEDVLEHSSPSLLHYILTFTIYCFALVAMFDSAFSLLSCEPRKADALGEVIRAPVVITGHVSHVRPTLWVKSSEPLWLSRARHWAEQKPVPFVAAAVLWDECRDYLHFVEENWGLRGFAQVLMHKCLPWM